MKLLTSIVLAAGAAIGTAAVINKVTDGYAKEAIVDKIFGIDDIEDDGIGEDLGPIKDFDLLTDEYGNKHVIMPADDAINLYRCIEESIGKIDPNKPVCEIYDNTDYEIYGDKALSFEKLYDCIESLLDTVSNDADEILNDQEEETDNLKDTCISNDDHNDIQKEMHESM